jgi:hypothetical protein
MRSVLTTPPLPIELCQPSLSGKVTVWGIMAAEEPQTLAVMLDPIAGCAHLDSQARAKALQMGWAFEERLLSDPVAEVVGLNTIGLYKRKQAIRAVFTN